MAEVSTDDAIAAGKTLQLDDLPELLPVLPIRDAVAFPRMVLPLHVERAGSRKLLGDLKDEPKILLALTQKDPTVQSPTADDLYDVGSVMHVLKLLKDGDDEPTVLLQGLHRVRVTEWIEGDSYLFARVEVIAEALDETVYTEALVLNVRTLSRRVIDLSPHIPDEAHAVINNIDDPGALSDFITANLPLSIPARQELLGESSIVARLKRVSLELEHQVEILELQQKIGSEVRQNIDRTQRDFYLNEQLKAIQQELGQKDQSAEELEELRDKLIEAQLPEPVAEEANREMGRLSRIPSASPEYNVLRTYLEILSELPWVTCTEDNLDIAGAQKILDADHYALEKVKRRIVEYLAVRKLAPQSRGPILCFVGPPGVGKTSLGHSIAHALGREFIRMSLGGIHDEAELRGHRRTYIGAMPGRILQEIRKCGSHNPVFMLDELDKVGSDFRGDPTSALLEILDPAQNSTFQDHYLNQPFDLSDVLFIATANYMGNVPAALRDRMEIIRIAGYTSREKLEIAKRYLVRRQRKDNGLKVKQITFPVASLETIIGQYTREAGVRELERQIGAVCRGVAAKVAMGNTRPRKVTPKLLAELLGPSQYTDELALRVGQPGVATGLAYTPVGGQILFIEATAYAGKGQLRITGQLGDVMKESAEAAFSLVKSRASELGLDIEKLNKQDIHLHVPAGAVPKDGPSAGVSIFTALASLLTGKTVRPDVAMTGEITLRGLVLPIGGVKEKVLAAKQAGITTVLLPRANKKDLVDVPADTQKGITFIFCKTVDDVLKAAATP